MAVYTIMRIYEVPADDRIEATDRMLEALEQGVERDYHVKDILRAPGGNTGHRNAGGADSTARLAEHPSGAAGGRK